jgi:uncharacterized BrkB/YihY/UPF0761 family membrane protein
VKDKVPSSNLGARAAQLNRYAAGMNKVATGFAAANVGGIALYAFLFLQILQTMRHEQRAHADFQDSLAFFITVFPILVVFVAVDLIWVAVMANQHRKHHDSRSALLVGVLAIAAWTITFYGFRHLV